MQVFISHSWKDNALARRLADVLIKAGFQVWDPFRNMLPGGGLAQMTAKALEESQAMVVLLTPESLESPYTLSEIEFALGNKNYAWRLIPVLVGDPKRFQEDQIPWILRKLQMVFLPEPENSEAELKQIVEVLRRPLDFLPSDFMPMSPSLTSTY
ncbi:MAG: toll/interleukin-1 receptor domain-containing protein [Blastocatellia bacterium]